jgi:hypothetical protein
MRLSKLLHLFLINNSVFGWHYVSLSISGELFVIDVLFALLVTLCLCFWIVCVHFLLILIYNSEFFD